MWFRHPRDSVSIFLEQKNKCVKNKLHGFYLDLSNDKNSQSHLFLPCKFAQMNENYDKWRELQGVLLKQELRKQAEIRGHKHGKVGCLEFVAI